MSAIAGAFSAGGTVAGDAVVRTMLARLARRGADATDVWGDGGSATLGVGRGEWATSQDIAGPAQVTVDEHVAVVSDASIYYRDELRAALAAAGVSAAADTPGALIAAAYRAWGERLTARLEGDYAFVLWDRRARKLFAARDFVGSRPLYYAAKGGTVALASTPGGVLAHPGVSEELNVVELGAMAAALFAGVDRESAFRDVRSLPVGHQLVWSVDRPELAVTRFWELPTFAGDVRPALPYADAAAALRELLMRATGERLAVGAPTGISLSGGWDSPAVFGAAEQVLAGRGLSPDTLRPVSVSFPEGDSGHEDGLIRAIVGRWGIDTHWVDIRSISLLGDAVAAARGRDEPFAHPYAGMNTALPRTARGDGARVMFNGMGGDHLFHVELSYLADLARRGRLVRLVRDWRAAGADRSTLLQMAVRPLLGATTQRLVARLRGAGAARGYLEPTLPPWIRRDFAESNDLTGRERRLAPRRDGRDVADFEKRWMLSYDFFPRITRATWDLSLDLGVEQRAPLLDERIVRFAATRPRDERRQVNESKRLLREAVRGLLPDHVLAPRPEKTGTMSDYFAQSLHDQFATIAAPLFERPLLAELGIVEPGPLCDAGARIERGQREEHSSALLFTLQVELWLRGRLTDAGVGTAAVAESAA